MLKSADKKTVRSLITQINRRKKTIAVQRDELRELISEVESICSDTDEAVEAMETVVDALSRLL